jgi:hypothetical protein
MVADAGKTRGTSRRRLAQQFWCLHHLPPPTAISNPVVSRMGEDESSLLRCSLVVDVGDVNGVREEPPVKTVSMGGALLSQA